MNQSNRLALAIGFALSWGVSRDTAAAQLRGTVVDAETGRAVAARLYIQDATGAWFFARSASADGSAVEYRKQRQAGSVEMHTTVSAHPYIADLPAGRYLVTVERGKEYLPFEQTVRIEQAPVEIRIALRRWTDMASRGWYSGDTHVHRTLAELPNLVLAEDLNVALPLTYWVTASHTAPATGNKVAAPPPKPAVIRVDDTHLVYPVNTEYEIFSVKGKPHTLGAVFVLGHRTPLELGVPPVAAVAEQARREGGLLELDKHSWNWSLMLVPVMKVDLFELSNNHVWRTNFGFRQWTIDTVPDYMRVERDADGLTEWGWIDFGFQTYYALLNSGYRMRPTAGTASGVHPVPLGFGRVYARVDGAFTYERWMQALNAGRSFVTTGPMLLVEFNGRDAGSTISSTDVATACSITGVAESAVPLDRVEVIVNGVVAETLRPANLDNDRGGFRSPLDCRVPLHGPSWVAVRTFERRGDRRVRFAHSAPVYVEMPGKPLRPTAAQVDYLAGRMEQELIRNQSVLNESELNEYRQALAAFRTLRD